MHELLNKVKNTETTELEQPLTIRLPKNEEELETVMNWAVKEGWNVGKYDSKAYYHAFPGGCWLLLLDEKPIGAIFLAQYSNNFTFIGLFIVEASHRGKGLGKKLWNYAMEMVEKMTSVGLYAVPQQVPMYHQFGFKNFGDVLRWKTQTPSTDTKAENKRILSLSQKNSDLITQYDKTMFPTPRFALIKAMLEMQQVAGFIMKKEEEVVGYGLIRACQEGYRLGPLYGNNFEEAKELTLELLKMAKVLNNSQETSVILDTLSFEHKFVKIFAEYFNLQRIKDADTQAMFKGEVPKEIKETSEKTYAVCSLELG